MTTIEKIRSAIKTVATAKADNQKLLDTAQRRYSALQSELETLQNSIDEKRSAIDAKKKQMIDTAISEGANELAEIKAEIRDLEIGIGVDEQTEQALLDKLKDAERESAAARCAVLKDEVLSIRREIQSEYTLMAAKLADSLQTLHAGYIGMNNEMTRKVNEHNELAPIAGVERLPDKSEGLSITHAGAPVGLTLPKDLADFAEMLIRNRSRLVKRDKDGQ